MGAGTGRQRIGEGKVGHTASLRVRSLSTTRTARLGPASLFDPPRSGAESPLRLPVPSLMDHKRRLRGGSLGTAVTKGVAGLEALFEDPAAPEH